MCAILSIISSKAVLRTFISLSK